MVVLSAADYARLVPSAVQPTVAALFANGPFARLDGFEDGLAREQAPFREAPDF